MVTGPGFSSPNQPDQERTTAYRASAGPNSRSDAHCVTIVGDWEEPSGESRLKTLRDELIDPVIARHRGEVLKRTGDGAYIRFDSVLDTMRCAVEVQHAKSMTISDSSRLMRRTNPRKD